MLVYKILVKIMCVECYVPPSLSLMFQDGVTQHMNRAFNTILSVYSKIDFKTLTKNLTFCTSKLFCVIYHSKNTSLKMITVGGRNI